jgi:transcriptional regulator with XRE-family HTH domain
VTIAMADFGDKLREARQRRGVSLREIADRTKISVAALVDPAKRTSRRVAFRPSAIIPPQA